MRLRCIKGDGFLTFGKFYNVIETYQAHYVVIDNLDCNTHTHTHTHTHTCVCVCE
jgi:hypothetical protein